MGITLAAPSQRLSLDVTRFGAKFDGTTDDTAAIQAAIDQAFASGFGGIVELPRGIAVVTGLVLKWGVYLRGRGMRQTTLKLANGANQHVIRSDVSSDVGVTDPNAQWCGILDLQIDGNKANQTTGTCHGIFMSLDPLFPASKPAADDYFDSHHLIQNVRVINARNTGVWVEGRSETRHVNVVSHLSGDYGFRVEHDTWYTDCTASWSGLYGFYCKDKSSFNMKGCKAFYNGQTTPASGYGFLFNNCHTASVTTCVSQDNRGGGFQFDNQCKGLVLVGVVADSNSTSGAGTYPAFDLWESSHNTIIGTSTERFAPGTQRNALRVRSNSGFNYISLKHQFINGATSGIAIASAVDDPSNIIEINGSRAEGVETVTYAASITPDPFLGSVKKVTLTGNLTVNAPTGTNFGQGTRMTFILAQDATGGRTVTFNAVFKTNWTPDTAANKINVIEFVYDGTNWQEVAASFTPPSATGIPVSIMDAKGDLIVGSAADTAVRLPVGADGRVLSALASQSTGLIWKEINPSVFNVHDYGAAGDGTTDDTTSINAAVAALQSAGGGILWFDGRKTYKVSGNGITFTANVKWAIQGNGAFITVASGGKGIYVDSLASDFSALGYKIENLHIEAVSGTDRSASSVGIYIRDTSGVLIENCYIKDLDRGIVMENFAATRFCERNIIFSCFIEWCRICIDWVTVSGTGSFDESVVLWSMCSKPTLYGFHIDTNSHSHGGGLVGCSFFLSLDATAIRLESNSSGPGAGLEGFICQARFDGNATTKIGVDATGSNKQDTVRFSLDFTGTPAFTHHTGLTVGYLDGPRRRAPLSAVVEAFLDDANFTNRFEVYRNSSGNYVLRWGDGTAAVDTTLYRGGANELKTDDRFTAVDGLATRVFSAAGKTTVIDGDWTQTPVNGQIGLVHNSTDNTAKIAVRVNGTWRYVAVA